MSFYVQVSFWIVVQPMHTSLEQDPNEIRVKSM